MLEENNTIYDTLETDYQVTYYRDEAFDVLAVADWGQKMSFYQLSGKQVRLKYMK